MIRGACKPEGIRTFIHSLPAKGNFALSFLRDFTCNNRKEVTPVVGAIYVGSMFLLIFIYRILVSRDMTFSNSISAYSCSREKMDSDLISKPPPHLITYLSRNKRLTWTNRTRKSMYFFSFSFFFLWRWIKQNLSARDLG